MIPSSKTRGSGVAKIALVGDYDANVTAHRAIPAALSLAAGGAHPIQYQWVGSDEDVVQFRQSISAADGVWCVPASPYRGMENVLWAIQFARENSVPFLGTCGGFQHSVLEFARNVLNLDYAGHAEVDPSTPTPLISPLSCALIEQNGEVRFDKGSLIHQIYSADSACEEYHCSFGFNRQYLYQFDGCRLAITGWTPDGQPQVVELAEHPFFVGTAFQPERSSFRDVVHPIVAAFVAAAVRKHQPNELVP